MTTAPSWQNMSSWQPRTDSSRKLMCETVSWLKARRIVKETNNKTLLSHSNDILECFGGIEKCLAILLENIYNIQTIQAIKLTDMLTEINNKEKSNQINTLNDENIENPDIQIITMTVNDIGTECIKHITRFLTTTDIAKSFNNVCASFAIIGIPESRKTDYFYMNGHDLIIENKNQYNTSKYKYTNKIGFAHFSSLKLYRTFKNEPIGALFTQLSIEVNIPLQHLSVRFLNCDYLSSGKNRLKEIILNSDAETQQITVTGMIFTYTMAQAFATYGRPRNTRSLDQRIGNVCESTRRLVLLDKRKIPTIQNADLDSQSSKNYRKMLIGIKYFDVFSQRLYFVDWVYVILHETKIEDLEVYIENNLMSHDRYYFQKCKKYLKKIKQFKTDNFIFYDEETHEAVHQTTYNVLFDDNYTCGDILVFQLNTDHPYFQNHTIRVETDLNRYQLQTAVYQRADYFMLSIPHGIDDCLHTIRDDENNYYE